MKRLIYPILSFSLLLTGCGGNVSTAETVKAFQTEPPETTATTEPTTEPPLSPAELRLSEMSLHEKVCQLFITAPSMFSDSGAFVLFDRVQSERIGTQFIGDPLCCIFRIATH